MEIKHTFEVPADPVEGLPGVTVRWLWADKDEVPNFALRMFEVKPGASTYYHAHLHEHEVYVVSGQGLLRSKDREHSLGPNDTVFVPGNEEHQFVNTGQDDLRFLCAVPLHS